MYIVAHNLAAMNTQRQFGINSKNKIKSSEKLSSGYKINRSADDAAGLAISEKMRRQIRGLSQGIANTQDGVSLCQVADGALAEVNDMLHRITELSVKSANGTNTEEERQYIQEEIHQILEEIERISDTTTFNERKIFSGAGGDSHSTTVTVWGSPNTLSEGSYSFNADESMITIGPHTISWDDVLHSDGSAIDKDAPKAGTYHFGYAGMQFDFTMSNGDTFADAVGLVDSISFDIVKETSTYTAVTVTDYGVTAGSDTENFLSKNGTRYLYQGGYSVVADDDGIYLADYPAQKKTWAELGVDFSTSESQTFQFEDSESGVYFSAEIAAGSPKEDVINSINNTEFYWGYIDMSTTENARLGYKASSITATTIKDSSAPLGSVRLSSFEDIYDELFEDLGYTTKASRLNGINLSVSISGTTKDDLKLTLTAENGNSTELSLYSWDPDIWEGYGYARPVFGYNDGAQVTLYTTYSTVNPPTEADAITYLGSLGELASNVSVSSPYYFDYKANKLRTETLSVDNLSFTYESTLSPKPASDDIWIQSGCEAGDGMYLEIDNMNTTILGIDDLDVSTVEGAHHALDAVKGALQNVSANRSKIGAQQNRLEHTIANEENVVENTTAAESRIRDTDMAKEMVNYSKINILEQVGHAMMAQANQSNQGVLSLLN